MVEKRALSQLSDDEVLALYKKHGDNCSAAAREVGCGPATFSQRMRLLNSDTYKASKERAEAVSFLMEELEARGVDPTTVNIKSATIVTKKNRHQGYYKNAEGTATVVPMRNDLRMCTIKLSPKFEEGPAWPVIVPATPAIVTYLPRPVARPDDNTRKVFIIPDVQVGYYRDVYTEKLTPFHDERAIDVMLQMLTYHAPDEIVILGDFLDLPNMSRWTQDPAFQSTLQISLQRAYNLLHEVRAIVGPDKKITYIAGNHERRMQEYIAINAKAAYGIRSVEKDPSKVDPVTLVPYMWKWPHLSIVELLHLKDLNIEYSAEYPSGQVWLTKTLVCQHQPDRKTDLRATIVHGHIPHASRDSRTIHHHDGSVEHDIVAVPGLMRTDDVCDPSQLSRSSVPSNQVRHNWQQGVCSITIFDNERHNIEIHRIKDGIGQFRDIEFTAQEK